MDRDRMERWLRESRIMVAFYSVMTFLAAALIVGLVIYWVVSIVANGSPWDGGGTVGDFGD